MSIFLNRDKDEGEANKNQAVGQQQPIPASAPSPGLIGGGVSPSQRTQSRSGRFTNIQQYMAANRAQNVAGKVAGQVGSQVEETQQKLEGAKAGFRQQVGAATQAMEANRQALQNLADKADEDIISSVRSGLETEYRGPSQLAGEQELAAQSQAVSGLAGMSQTAGGREQLLRQLFGRPTYTAGQAALDSLLLGTGGKQLADVRARARAVGREAQEAGLGAAIEAQIQSDVAKGIREQAFKTGEEQVGIAKSTLEKAQKDFLDKEKAKEEAYKRVLSGTGSSEDIDTIRGLLSNEALQALGLTPVGGMAAPRMIALDDNKNLAFRDPRTLDFSKALQELDRLGLGFKTGTAELGAFDPKKAALFNQLNKLLGKADTIQPIEGGVKGGGFDEGATAALKDYRGRYESDMRRVVEEYSPEEQARSAELEKYRKQAKILKEQMPDYDKIKEYRDKLVKTKDERERGRLRDLITREYSKVDGSMKDHMRVGQLEHLNQKIADMEKGFKEFSDRKKTALSQVRARYGAK